MGVFCDELKLGSTAALNCRTGQNKGYCKKKVLIPTGLIRYIHANFIGAKKVRQKLTISYHYNHNGNI